MSDEVSFFFRMKETFMPKAMLKFNLPEESEEFDSAFNGWKYKLYFEEVWQNLFRPRHKHGYPNARLNELLEKPEVTEAFDILEELYRDVRRYD